MAVTHTTVFRSAVANLIGDTCNNGFLQFRAAGTADAPGAVYATLGLAADAAPNSVDGTLTFGAISSDTNTDAGTVATATIETSVNVIKVHCAVTAAAGDINMSNGLILASGDTVSCSSLTYAAMP